MGDPDFSDFISASVAQLVERENENLCVTGSIPVRGTMRYNVHNYEHRTQKMYHILNITKEMSKMRYKNGACSSVGQSDGLISRVSRRFESDHAHQIFLNVTLYW